jgi:hypothetical protein
MTEVTATRIGWDDRKKLAGIWQDHAPLPAEGLSERVYEALIEVARYGAALADEAPRGSEPE